MAEAFVQSGRRRQIGRAFKGLRPNGDRLMFAVFECACGSRDIVAVSRVKTGMADSCGCATMDALKEGRHNKGRTPKHGKSATKTYHAWSNIIQRCTNPKNRHYANYGGRGITVCDEWRQSFKAFLEEVGEPESADLTIDRIDNERGYEPGNVRWVSRKVNQRNRRVNHIVCYQGEDITVAELSERTGIKAHVLYWRLNAGWTLEETLAGGRNV